MVQSNWTYDCGSNDLTPWDKDSQDFGHCFFLLCMQMPVCFLLSITSAYYIGQRRMVRTYFGHWNTCQSGIIYTRSVIVSLLALSSVFELMSRLAIFGHPLTLVACFLVSLQTFTWFLHLLYVTRLKRGGSFNTRGPKIMMGTWFLSAIVAVLSFRSRYIAISSHQNPYFIDHGVSWNHHETKYESRFWLWMSGWKVLLQGAYLLTLIPGSTHLEPRHYRHRSRVRDIVTNAYETHESNSFVGFDHDEDEDELPLGVAKEDTGYFSKLLFLWVTPLLKKGACGFLRSVESLFDLPIDMSTSHIAIQFQSFIVSQKYGLIKSLHKAFGVEFYSIGLLKLLSDGFGFCGPILLNYLVSFIEGSPSQNKQSYWWEGYAYVGGLMGTTFLGALCNSHFNMMMTEVKLKMRGALMTTIYRKTVHMNKTTVERLNTGEIINFMSIDTDRIVNSCPSFHAFWSLPIQVGITLYLLYLQINVSFLAGVIFAIVLIPINRLIANKIAELSTKMMKYKDQRVKLMSEILYGIRILKFHSWQKFFYNKVNAIRTDEMASLKGRKYLDAMCVYFWATTPVLVSLLSFGTYVLLGNTLTAAKVFTSLALFNMLISPLNALPWVLNGLVEAWVSVKRISHLLECEETELVDIYKTPKSKHDPQRPQDSFAITVENGRFQWTRQDENAPFEIGPINLKIKKGAFIGVVGQVGSGKTSFLMSLLGELIPLENTTLTLDNPTKGIGYVAQEAWIQRGNIRKNICFYPNVNLTRYKSVVLNCSLGPDLDSFKNRDDTLVGDNGLTLSGGQKIRLTLARAVYQDFNIYLLDDIFSAVDYKVARSLYKRVVMGCLREKTRIVCTHHVRFLSDADWIIVLEHGRIVKEGLPKDILPNDGEEEDDTDVDTEKDSATEGSSNHARRFSLQESLCVSSLDDLKRLDDDVGATSPAVMSRSFEFPAATVEGEGDETNEEVQGDGMISMHVYKFYYRSVGQILCWLILLSLVGMQASRNFGDIWLGHWVGQMNGSPNSSVPHPTPLPKPTFETIHEDGSQENEAMTENANNVYWTESLSNRIPYLRDLDSDVKYYFSVYIIIGVVNSLFTLARAFLFALGGITGAIKVQQALLHSMLNAKMSFFDRTPIGRIINRFSSDVATIDDSLPFISNILLAQIFSLLGALVVTCLSIPWVLVVVIPLLLVCHNIQEYYRHTARELRRLGSISLSPVYAHFSETLKGLVTIRAMRAVKRFEESNEEFIECSQKCEYSSQAVSQWLNFRLQMVGVVVVSSVGLLGVIQHSVNGSGVAGLVGLAIAYALTFTNSLGGVISFLTETEKEMVAVERACEYIEEVEPEYETEGRIQLPFLWPAQGVLEYNLVSLRYTPDHPYVLRSISLHTRPAEKIGIVGRTGSGKSSLFSALFRLVDSFEGDIVIDTVNIRELSLRDLRSKLCIIPQDPLIFSGSLRENLDPRQTKTEEELSRAIEKCQLRTLLHQIGGLDGYVGESGSLLSTGQKQLVCLARALLVNPKILCIDEATANVDAQTDKVIQTTLRTCFGQTTVLTVAHRVNSILHCDRVIVMSHGEILEMDDPHTLISNTKSMFYQLAHGLK